MKRIAWSFDGDLLAVPAPTSLTVWEAGEGKNIRRLKWSTDRELRESDRFFDGFLCAAWAPRGTTLLAGCGDGRVLSWDVSDGRTPRVALALDAPVFSVAWSPRATLLAAASRDGSVVVRHADTLKEYLAVASRPEPPNLAWSPDGRFLPIAAASEIHLWDVSAKTVAHSLHVAHAEVTNLAWSPDARLLVVSALDGRVEMWDIGSGRRIRTLEAHSGAVSGIAFSSDASLLAYRSFDDDVYIWSTRTWDLVAQFAQPSSELILGGLAFDPHKSRLATCNDRTGEISIWDIDVARLIAQSSVWGTVHTRNAKVVLVGESNVGKSCLARRLVEDTYAEQPTTHGMQIWRLPAEKVGIDVDANDAGYDIVLWDLGGQHEYRLVHQLFLHDTTVALFLVDPTRGSAALEEVEAWNASLERQLRERTATKILVGTKLDESSDLVNTAEIRHLCERCGIESYFETSAKNGSGIADLLRHLGGVIQANGSTTASRPRSFAAIRGEIARRARTGEVLVMFDDLLASLNRAASEADARDSAEIVDAVVRQLALQGTITDTRLGSDERALILDIGHVERYASALLVGARSTPRGVPWLPTGAILSPTLSLPGLASSDRLPRLHERAVLECVVRLFLDHGIAFEHSGLLVFPALFPSSSRPSREGAAAVASSVSYDFAGPIDNIYSGLVVALAISDQFGRVRLWADQAEYEYSERGACGIRKAAQRAGFAHLEVYFDDEVAAHTRAVFSQFVDSYLREHGVALVDHISLTCDCGYVFREEDLRGRIERGFADVGCARCDRRVSLQESAEQIREPSWEVARKTWALRTKIDRRRETMVERSRLAMEAETPARGVDGEIVILHLGDLHLRPDADPHRMLRPLLSDLRGAKAGLGLERVHYVVVPGDVAHRAMPEEFELGHRFLASLIKELDLTADRCIVTPGNHDLSWDEPAYEWRQSRLVNADLAASDRVVPQGAGYLVRDEERYRQRFARFSRVFFHPLLQREYPLDYERQAFALLFPEDRLQFICLNSCWQIDEFHQERSSIHAGAISRCLQEADAQVEDAVQRGLCQSGAILRIGVWHHPVTGNEKIADDAFLELLSDAGVQLALHGHVHEERTDSVLMRRVRPAMAIIGCGAFGASASERPESTPRLYNVIRVNRRARKIRVDTRCMRRQGGGWEGWAYWPGNTPDERRTYFELLLPETLEHGSRSPS